MQKWLKDNWSEVSSLFWRIMVILVMAGFFVGTQIQALHSADVRMSERISVMEATMPRLQRLAEDVAEIKGMLKELSNEGRR